ncbi:DUF4823 domain-containing protein [Zooshikella marina]|uniref:DUF4823 domain-containing protein n=1 Tax=Zooshikella ganghwensis TaxID=202772 RepID=UPI001BAFA632|nr:DUF4823 domain-containing protein [Zooshikella ganghwensis]MBU2705120.1 DUF4823 domain-containing protein [Zooshikella ganghwensis]
MKHQKAQQSMPLVIFHRASTLGLIMLLLSGCMPSDIASETQRYLKDIGIIDNHQQQRTSNWVLPNNARILVIADQSPPVDHRQPDYAKRFALATTAAFKRYFPYTDHADKTLSFVKAQQEARRQHANYLVFTQLLLVDDQVGNWIEWEETEDIRRVGRDQVRGQVSIVELGSGQIVDTIEVLGKSGRLTFINDKPDELFEAPLVSLVRSLAAPIPARSY